jgi:hypothetical protein
MSDHPTRRDFLKTVIVASASCALPGVLVSRANVRSFWFLHTPSNESWPIDDPVIWSWRNARQPILERARERLLSLDAGDPQRIIRLVVRRCKLNLIEIRSGQVEVDHWGKMGLADLRPFFKQHRLARKGVRVTLIDRKKELTTIQTGADFLYGERLAEDFPLEAYVEKWRKRSGEEPDDWTPTPCSGSSFCWEGVEPGWIPWRVLKSAWRHEDAPLCQNCDKPTILVGFGRVQCGMFNWGHTFHRICPECQRRFEDNCLSDLEKWIVANLHERCWPDFQMIWGCPVKWVPPVVS